MKANEKVGLNFLNLKAYLQAAHLTNIIGMHSQTYISQWVTIEEHYSKQQDLAVMMWVPKGPLKLPNSTLSTTRLLPQSWNEHRCLATTTQQWSLATPIRSLQAYNDTFNHCNWKQHGLTHIHQLYTENGLKTFPELQE
ncbi:Hypothetical predicted protein, partial [Pelobates cultripes]